jgi:hypothetical protein
VTLLSQDARVLRCSKAEGEKQLVNVETMWMRRNSDGVAPAYRHCADNGVEFVPIVMIND